jgi:hypothetical protein
MVNPNIMFITLAPLLDRIALSEIPADEARFYIEGMLPEGYVLTEMGDGQLTIVAPSLARCYQIEVTPRAITIKAGPYNVH